MIHKLFSTFVVFITMFAVGAAHADGTYPDAELTSSNAKIKERLLKMRGLLAKQKTCVVAIDGMFAKFYTLDVREEYLPKTVTCVGDIVVNKDTLKEKSGCALVTYNLDRATYGAFFNNYFPQAMSTKTCDNGGFEDLMQMKGWWSGDAYQDSTVEQTIFTPRSYQEPWKFILVYSQSDRYSQWFADARKRGEEFVAKKREPELKKQAAQNQRELAEEKREQQKKAKAKEERKKKEALWN